MDFIVILWHLILLQARPYQMPASNNLLTLSCVFMIAMGVLYSFASGVEPINRLEVFVDLIFLMLFLKVLLHLFRYSARFTQTAISITGALALFSVLFIPISFLAVHLAGFGGEAQDEMQQSPLGAVLAIFYIMLIMWLIRVLAHIFMYALEVRISFAMGIAILYFTSGLLVKLILLN